MRTGGFIAVVGLKAGGLTEHSFGQLYDYVKDIETLEPHRRLIAASFLCNLLEGQFVMLDNHSNRRTRFLRYKFETL